MDVKAPDSRFPIRLPEQKNHCRAFVTALRVSVGSDCPARPRPKIQTATLQQQAYPEVSSQLMVWLEWQGDRAGDLCQVDDSG